MGAVSASHLLAVIDLAIAKCAADGLRVTLVAHHAGDGMLLDLAPAPSPGANLADGRQCPRQR